MGTDFELLDAFVRNRSEDAFKTLLDRHLKLVYGAALRQVNNPDMAQDIAQAVFFILARKALSVNKKRIPLIAWLLTVTRYAVINELNRQRAQARHEREAAAMKTQSASAVDSEALSSIIDEAMNRLSGSDRTAIAAYYLENRNLREVGDVLAVSEDAAQKRVSRALDRLKVILARRGIVCTADALEASLHQYGAVAVPPMLLAAVLSGALGHSAVSGAGSLIARQVLKKMLLAKVKIVVLSAAVAGVAAAPTVPLVYHALSGHSATITTPLPSPAPIPTAYTVIDLTPAGLSQASAMGIWGNQQVGIAYNDASTQHAMLWLGTAASVVDLNPNGFLISAAYATNGRQQVGYGRDQAGQFHALQWNGSAAKYADLNPDGFAASQIYDISGGQEVGDGVIPDGSGGVSTHAMLWIDKTNQDFQAMMKADGAVEELEINVHGLHVDKYIIDLNPKGFSESEAQATDGFQQVGYGTPVGSTPIGIGLTSLPQQAGNVRMGQIKVNGGTVMAKLTLYAEHALLWSGSAVSVVDLNPKGFISSEARGISGLQQVGYGTNRTGPEMEHALLWTHGSAASVVDLNPNGFISSQACATNGRQQVGFGNTTSNNSQHALLWNSSANNFVDLNQFLPAGFIQAMAISINAQGEIVGEAVDGSGNWHAIEWVPASEAARVSIQPDDSDVYIMGLVERPGVWPIGRKTNIFTLSQALTNAGIKKTSNNLIVTLIHRPDNVPESQEIFTLQDLAKDDDILLQNNDIVNVSNAAPNALPADIVAAWEKAGAQSGWMDSQGNWYLSTDGQPGEVPAFRFKQWTPWILFQLPEPNQNFGLDLESTNITNSGLKELAGFTQLLALNLGYDQVTDAGLKELDSLTQLQVLVLGGNQVTGAGMKELAGLAQLNYLDLSFTHATDSGLNGLADLTQLQTLDLNNTYVTDTGLKELSGLTQLQTLDLDYDANVTDAGLNELASLTQLQTLSLRNTSVTDAGLIALTGLTQLQTLNLDGLHMTDVGLKELANMKQLQLLSFFATPVTDANLKELAGLKQLQTLDLGKTQVTDVGLQQLAGFTKLQMLVLGGTQITDSGLKELAGLTQLQMLFLDNTHVTDSGLRELAGLTQLIELSLQRTQVTDAGLKELAGLSKLQVLDLDMTSVTDSGLKELTGLTQLQELSLTDTKVTNTGVAELQKALPNLQIIR
ncbi:MAG TPA: sigma-70 family RNA polymerase sigma factor [Phycisphaerae bacterium]|nr:sigma-70 family RNA polymerase sigma factor [Phycisphaerae bacterium]